MGVRWCSLTKGLNRFGGRIRILYGYEYTDIRPYLVDIQIMADIRQYQDADIAQRQILVHLLTLPLIIHRYYASIVLVKNSLYVL